MSFTKKILRKIIALITAFTAIYCFTACGAEQTVKVKDISERYPDAHKIVFSDDKVTIDGNVAEEFDYVWHADPSSDHKEVKNSPAEYYTGTAPSTQAVAYIAHDIKYYPSLDQSSFTQVFYDDDTEWAYYYTAEGYDNYIFGTLPVSKTGFPSDMMHTEEEAYENPVLHIVKAGEYILEGSFNGQVYIDLGDSDEIFTDENAKVTLIFNNVNINCDVAPGVIFYSAFECDNSWEDRETYNSEVDLSNTGANVIIADGSVNTVNGSNVYRMLKTKYKDETVTKGVQTQKKLLKTDGAFYSYVSMSINGESENTGILNINSEFEGLDTELHLAINGGIVNIYSQDDGINVNEDGVSVVQINDGNIHILGGLGSEGDGIDSNGFLVINGGTVVASASPMSDSGLDSDKGSYIYGGTVIALGSTMDWAESDGTDNTQPVMNLQFSSYQSADEEIEIKDSLGTTVFSYEPETDTFLNGHGRQYIGAVISSSELKTGVSYTVYVGGIQQGYSGTNLGFGGFGGNFGGGNRPQMHDNQFDPGTTTPGGFDRNFGGGDRPQMPDNQFDPGTMTPGSFGGNFGGGNRPQMPDKTPGEFSQNPDGISQPTSETGNNPEFNNQHSNVKLISIFTLEDTVNGFSGVSDYTE